MDEGGQSDTVQTSPIGFIKEEIVRGKDGAEVSRTYYEEKRLYRQQKPHRFENVPSLRPSLLAASLSFSSVIAHILR